MTTLYTATGRFEIRSDSGGRKYPVIILGGEEYTPGIREMIIWVTLNWRILELPQVRALYGERLVESDVESSGYDFDENLSRLIRCGIVVYGIGTTDADALGELLGTLQIVPLTASPLKKAAVFLKMLVLDGVPFRTAASVFHRGRLTELERQIIALVRHTALSTTELIRYAEAETSEPVKYNVLEAVANLYLHRQILFERF